MLNRAHITRLLDKHQPFDTVETKNIEQFRKFIDNINLATGRSAHPIYGGQLTAAAWIIDPLAHKLLLVWNEKLQKWLNPGGKYEPGDCLVTRTMQREARQECGVSPKPNAALLDIGVIGQDYNPRLPCTFYDLRFQVFSDSRRPLYPQESGTKPTWVSLFEAKQKLPDTDIQNYRLYRRTERYFGRAPRQTLAQICVI